MTADVVAWLGGCAAAIGAQCLLLRRLRPAQGPRRPNYPTGAPEAASGQLGGG